MFLISTLEVGRARDLGSASVRGRTTVLWQEQEHFKNWFQEIMKKLELTYPLETPCSSLSFVRG